MEVLSLVAPHAPPGIHWSRLMHGIWTNGRTWTTTPFGDPENPAL